ncbi:MAG: septal ring lytic transglycosylase RlpA family protein [Calditrichaeota bacterium]|nr:septal ring lytic transglycosylase RlpA family protein [Calditrichota bacterium]
MKAQERVQRATRGLVVGAGVVLAVLIWSCTPAPRTYWPQANGGERPYRGGLFGPSPSKSRVQEGYCSYVGKELEGKRMSNGEPYDPLEMTAAHRNLRIGTVVKVTNMNNGRSVRVVIKDRGPWVASRLIDVSYGAAHRLGMVSQGVVPVTVEVIGDIRDPNVTVDERLAEATPRQSEWLGKAVQGFERLVDWVLNKN